MRVCLLVFVGVLAASCGGGIETSASSSTSTTVREATTTTEPVEKSAVFDLSPIAGEWSGVLGANRDATARIAVELEFKDQGRRGSVVATVQYTQMSGDRCEGTLSALRVDGPEYLFFQSMKPGSCPWPGQVRILHNAEADELAYRASMENFDGEFTGSLEREDD